jgi:hypothetical protein
MSTHPIDLLSLQLGEVLSSVLSRGFEPPLHVAIVGVDGVALLFARCEQHDDSLGTTFLAEHAS